MMDPKVEAEYEEYKAAGRIWGVIDKENIKKIKFPRVPKEIVDGFKALEDDLTGTVSDILDALGYNKVIPANVLPPIEPGHLIVGTAVTLRSIPIEKTTTQGLRDHDFIKMASREVNYLAEPGDVLVGDAGGMTEMSSMGGQSFVCLQSNKDQFTSLEDTNKPELSIGAQNGSIQKDLADQNSPDADIVVLEGGHNLVALDMIMQRIQHHIDGK